MALNTLVFRHTITNTFFVNSILKLIKPIYINVSFILYKYYNKNFERNQLNMANQSSFFFPFVLFNLL